MAASYPSSVKSFTTKVDGAGNIIAASHVNDLQDEVVAIETDLLAAWVSYIPTWTNLTVGNGTVEARYKKVGKFVAFKIHITFGASTTVDGLLGVSLPATAAGTASRWQWRASGLIRDTGVTGYPLTGLIVGGTGTVVIYTHQTTGTYASLVQVQPAIPLTPNAGDELMIQGVYESTT